MCSEQGSLYADLECGLCNPVVDVLGEQPVIIHCCRCGTQLGVIVSVEGEELLQIGDVVLVRSIHSACRRCGTSFHWTMSDRILERIIKRYTGSE